MSAIRLICVFVMLGIFFQENAVASEPSRLSALIQRLHGPDVKDRSKALDGIKALAAKGLSKEETAQILKAAADQYPPLEFDFVDTPSELLRAAAPGFDGPAIPLLKRLYPGYGPAAKAEALGLLAASYGPEAASAFVELALASARELPGLRAGGLMKDPRHGTILFPAVLELVEYPALEWSAASLCLKYFSAGALRPGSLDRHGAPLLAAYERHEKLLSTRQGQEGLEWMWQEDYREARGAAGLLLDLFGYFRSAATGKILERALRFNDPRLKHFAALSLLRRGEQVPEKVFAEIAASPEMRNWLYRGLREQGRLGLFPARYRTQAAFAESEMVDWLLYPTELGRPPDKIQLMKVVRGDSPRGAVDYYLFRFRTRPPHWAAKDGWMAGVAGPFAVGEPNPESLGVTFSTFTPWESQSEDEHLSGIVKLMNESRAAQQKEAN